MTNYGDHTCQHVVGDSACKQRATKIARIPVNGKEFNVYVCDSHAQAVEKFLVGGGALREDEQGSL
jgi:hypothetical protein